MNTKKLNLNLLQSLDALLSECNVSRAAEKCFITQSAMSNALNQLRDVFNDELLIRAPKRMTLSAKATILQPQLHRLITEMQALMLEEPLFNAAESTRIFEIGMSDIAEFLLLPTILEKLKKEAPNIQLHIQHVNEVSSHKIFTKGEMELATGCFFEETAYLEKKRCFKFKGVVIARKNHPLMQKKMSMKDYLSAKHIRVQYRSGLGHTNTDRVLKESLLERDVVATLPHITPVFFMLQKNDFIATIPGVIPESILNKLGLTVQPLPFKIPTKNTYTIWSKEKNSDPGLVWLRGVIDYAAEKVQGKIKNH